MTQSKKYIPPNLPREDRTNEEILKEMYRVVKVDGVIYKGIKDIEKKLGLRYNLIYQRVRRGFFLEEAIQMGENMYFIYVEGKRFNSLEEVADFHGIDYVKLKRKNSTDKGKTLEQMIEEIKSEGKIVYKGVQYANLTELAIERGIDARILYSRIYKGWRLERAVSQPVSDNTPVGKQCTFRGKTYNAISSMTNSNGFSVILVNRLARGYGITKEGALEMLVNFFSAFKGERPKLISSIPYLVYNGEWIESRKEFLDIVGVNAKEYGYFSSKLKEDAGGKEFTPLEIVGLMEKQKRTRYRDIETGEFALITDLVKKYGRNANNLVRDKKIKREQVKLYPNIMLDTSGYCETIRDKFEKYVETYLPFFQAEYGLHEENNKVINA